MKHLFKLDFGDRRIYGLDIVRALAIIFVVAAHGANLLPHRLTRLHEIFLVDGVFVFFVLSGFLIGGILIKMLEAKKTKVHDLFEFWVRRWFRIIPVYYLIIVVLLVVRHYLLGGVQNGGIWKYFLFIQNLHTPQPPFFSETWTLSVEEWFYLLVPVLLFVMVGLLKIKAKKAVLTTVLLVIAASIWFRYQRYTGLPIYTVSEWDSVYRKEVITRLDTIIFGVLGAFVAFYHQELWFKYKRPLFWLGLCTIIAQQAVSLSIAFGPTHFGYSAGLYLSVYSFVIEAVGMLLLLPMLSSIKSGSGKLYRLLTTVSIASYSMYLIHVSLVQPLLFKYIPGQPSDVVTVVRYALYWGITIGVATLLYKYFERPMTDVRNRFVRKKHNATGPPI